MGCDVVTKLLPKCICETVGNFPRRVVVLPSVLFYGRHPRRYYNGAGVEEIHVEWRCVLCYSIRMKKTLTLLFIVLTAVTHPTAAQTQRWVHYEPETVELDGRLTLQSKFGPPNYGEDPKTDEKVRVPVLLLRTPISVLANAGNDYNSTPVYNARQVQLAFITTGITHTDFIGKDVVVSGTLFHAHTGHHYTDVVLSVRSIELRPIGYGRQRFDVCQIVTSSANPQKRQFSSNEMLTEFRAIVGEETTDKSFKHAQTGLIISAGVQYRPPGAASAPDQMRIGISISNKEEDVFDITDSAVAGTKYGRGWAGLYVTKRVTVGDTEHTFTLSCAPPEQTKRSK